MITQKLNLSLVPGGVPPRINVSRYDVGSRTLEFHLINGYSDDFTIPDNSEVILEGSKKDEKIFAYHCTYDGSDVYSNVTRQMTILAGEVECELVIIDEEDNVLGSANFVIVVENSPIDDESISEDDIGIFNDYIEQMKELKDEAVSEAGTASKTWAVGGTGTREGEDTDNSKYYCEEAKTTTADAISEMETIKTDTVTEAEAISKSWAVGGTGARTGEDTDNSKYYSEQASTTTEEAIKTINTTTQAAIKEMNTIKTQTVTEAETISKSWAVGGTGARTGENTNNSEYWSNQASNQAVAAAESAAQAAMYAGVVMPKFYLNIEDGYLYYQDGKDIDFKVDEDEATLYVKIGG